VRDTRRKLSNGFAKPKASSFFRRRAHAIYWTTTATWNPSDGEPIFKPC